LDARNNCSSKHAQGAGDSRPDQLVLVLRLGERERRGDVDQVSAAGQSIFPARFMLEVGDVECQAVRRAVYVSRKQGGTQGFGSGEVSGGRADNVALCEQLVDNVRADEASAARHADRRHGCQPQAIVTVERDVVPLVCNVDRRNLQSRSGRKGGAL
jgi:hypothetical protein